MDLTWTVLRVDLYSHTIRFCTTIYYINNIYKLTTEGSDFATVGFRNEISELQSESVLEADGMTVNDVEQKENLVFEDAMMTEDITLDGNEDPTLDEDDDYKASLSTYLSRPVNIDTFTWSQGSSTNPVNGFPPWYFYLRDSKVQRKTQNYSRLHAKLHLKFVMNASPFFYGALRVTYEPRRLFAKATSNANELVQVSQLPGVWLTPQDSTGAELVVPFINDSNWISPQSITEQTNMGFVRFYVYSDLQSSNGTTGASITISTYAWLEDIHLAGPTSSDVLQSKPVKDGAISGLADKVATVAGKMSSIPFVGSYASAASTAASVVGSVAAAFGFSNAPVTKDVDPFVPKSYHAFANCETSMPNDKLCIDPKNETPMDNAVAGTDSSDPLVLSNFLRESYIDQFTWTTPQATETSLRTFPVSPSLIHSQSVSSGTTNGTLYYFTPMAYASRMFHYWRGSIIYRFKVIKTKYHKGRLRISWDPDRDITATTDTETTCFTRLIDLDDTDEFEFEVPYKAKNNFLNTSALPTSWNFPTTNSYPQDSNGYLNIRVQNVLSGPTGSATIQVLVFQRPGADFQFAKPNELPQNLTHDALQSTSVIDGKNGKTGDHITDMSIGEQIASIRPLLHRTHLSFSQLLAKAESKGAGLHQICLGIPRMPPMYGRSNGGPMPMTYPAGSANPGTVYGWYCATHPLWWIQDCFVGYRGSIIVSANITGGSSTVGRRIESASIERYPSSHLIDSASSTCKNTLDSTLNNVTASAFASYANLPFAGSAVKAVPTGNRGMTITKEITQAALSAVSPQYIRGRMKVWDPFNTGSVSDYGGDNFRLDVQYYVDSAYTTALPPTTQIYYSAGVDFNPVFFGCTPALYDWGALAPV